MLLNANHSLKDLLQEANHSLIDGKLNFRVFQQAVQKARKAVEILIYNNDLAFEWKELSANAAKYLDLPFSSKVSIKIKYINAYISKQPFFPAISSNLCGELFNLIISHLNIHNPFLTRLSPELKALACVSKKWNYPINKLQILHVLQHTRLKDQEKLILGKNFQKVEQAVAFIIKKNLQVANLKKFNTLTDDLLKELFEKGSNIKHLTIQFNRITRLTEQCNQLQTLICKSCYQLVYLPDMPKLTNLDCRGCFRLKSLPSMPKLKHLNCRRYTKITSLPPMPELISLDCSSCKSLTNLSSMPELISLDCSSCKSLTNLSSMPELISLDYSNCVSILRLPPLPKLTSLKCKSLRYSQLQEAIDPDILMQLTSLNCRDSYRLSSLPNMPELTSLDCSSCIDISSLPSMPKLTSLRCEFLKFNQLENFIGLSLLTQLTSLHCSRCYELTSLPLMPKLTRLDCSYCLKLTSLPAMPKLKKLENEMCSPHLVLQNKISPIRSQNCTKSRHL